MRHLDAQGAQADQVRGSRRQLVNFDPIKGSGYLNLPFTSTPSASESLYETQSGSKAKLAKASIVHPRDPGSNLSSDRKYFIILFVPHLNPNL
jgi:hypothetical protein